MAFSKMAKTKRRFKRRLYKRSKGGYVAKVNTRAFDKLTGTDQIYRFQRLTKSTYTQPAVGGVIGIGEVGPTTCAQFYFALRFITDIPNLLALFREFKIDSIELKWTPAITQAITSNGSSGFELGFKAMGRYYTEEDATSNIAANIYAVNAETFDPRKPKTFKFKPIQHIPLETDNASVTYKNAPSAWMTNKNCSNTKHYGFIWAMPYFGTALDNDVIGTWEIYYNILARGFFA